MNFKFFSILFALLACITLPAAAQQIERNQAITISVQGVPDQDRMTINNTYPVAQNGTINMPFIGSIQAAGLLPEQLASNLQSRYRAEQIYTSPTFQVMATSSDTLVEQVVHVGGLVRRTGPVRYTNGLTIYQAVQAAGGPTEFGSMRRVRLFRDGAPKTYDLTQQQFMRIPLRPNDTIEVPQKDWRGR